MPLVNLAEGRGTEGREMPSTQASWAEPQISQMASRVIWPGKPFYVAEKTIYPGQQGVFRVWKGLTTPPIPI